MLLDIVKPPHSRRVNSERYLVANGFLGGKKDDETEDEEEEEEKEKEEKGEKGEQGEKEGEKEKDDTAKENGDEEKREDEKKEEKSEEDKEKEQEEKKREEENYIKYKLAVKILEKAHKSGFTDISSIISLFPIEWLKNGIHNYSSYFIFYYYYLTSYLDTNFVESINSMCTELCTRQTEALEVVMDEVDTKRF